MEIVIVGAILIAWAIYYNVIDIKKLVKDNKQYFKMFKESDYEFYVKARYGDRVDPEELFMSRIKNAGIVFILFLFIFITNFTFINLLLSVVIAFVIFKSGYSQLKKYYKTHLHDIDMQLPYYLKSLEILAQHYTIPVAIGKSMSTAPEIFKSGLMDLIEKINAGDSTIDPYMEFAKQYPVRDSIRMMRLLYRLSLGSNEHKQEQLLMFSRNVSILQNKSREMKYRSRLEKMEKKTMLMLVVTGGGSMLVMLMSIMMQINS